VVKDAWVVSGVVWFIPGNPQSFYIVLRCFSLIALPETAGEAPNYLQIRRLTSVPALGLLAGALPGSDSRLRQPFIRSVLFSFQDPSLQMSASRPRVYSL